MCIYIYIFVEVLNFVLLYWKENALGFSKSPIFVFWCDVPVGLPTILKILGFFGGTTQKIEEYWKIFYSNQKIEELGRSKNSMA